MDCPLTLQHTLNVTLGILEDKYLWLQRCFRVGKEPCLGAGSNLTDPLALAD